MISYPSALNGNVSSARLSTAAATFKDVPLINNHDNKMYEGSDVYRMYIGCISPSILNLDTGRSVVSFTSRSP
jgi:hypothetical protein